METRLVGVSRFGATPKASAHNVNRNPLDCLQPVPFPNSSLHRSSSRCSGRRRHLTLFHLSRYLQVPIANVINPTADNLSFSLHSLTVPGLVCVASVFDPRLRYESPRHRQLHRH